MFSKQCGDGSCWKCGANYSTEDTKEGRTNPSDFWCGSVLEMLLKLQAEPLLGNPTFDTVVGANRVDPAGRLEVSVEDTECNAGPDDGTRLGSLWGQRERNHLSRDSRVTDRSDFLPFAKHGRSHHRSSRCGWGLCGHCRGWSRRGSCRSSCGRSSGSGRGRCFG